MRKDKRVDHRLSTLCGCVNEDSVERTQLSPVVALDVANATICCVGCVPEARIKISNTPQHLGANSCSVIVGGKSSQQQLKNKLKISRFHLKNKIEG